MKPNFLVQGLFIITVILVISIFSFPSSADAGLVIRGGQCSAAAFEKGAESVQQASKGNYIIGLSVNYTDATSDRTKFASYTTGIPGSNYCVATSEGLGKNNAVIKKDPISGNPLHAKLSGLSKDIAAKLTRP